MKVNYRIIALFSGTVMLVVLGVAISFWSFSQIEESAQKRTQTSFVLKRTNDLLSSVLDAETSTRGYLLTGDAAFLEPYLAVRDNFDSRVEELRQLTLNSPSQVHMDELTLLVNARLAHLARAIELYQNNEEASAIQTVRSGEGRRLMDLIRVEIKSINQIEEDALAQHETEFQANMRFLFVILNIASVSVLLLSLLFLYLIYRETQQRVKNLVHLETKSLLDIQQELNQQLEQINFTLRVSEEKLFVTLNSIGDAVIATDADGLVELLNPLAEQLTGWTKAEAVGHPIDEVFQIIKEETRQPVAAPVMETLKQGTVHGLANHTLLIARDGSECPIADSCAPIREHDGRVVGAVLVFRNVTERNRQDQILRDSHMEMKIAKSVAEKASLAKSDFLSSMSHELRSPLNAILGFAQLMESDSPPPTSSQKQSIDQISQAGWYLLNLINEILDLARVESGQATISPEPVSLAEVMLECQKIVQSQAQQRDIQLTFPNPDIQYFVRADRTRLKQVLINLLSNAIKYNLEHGMVVVKYSRNTPGHIRVSITDSGAGLSAEQLPQLFQAFNRLGQEAGGVEGTGIGLVVAKRLIELMGGVIGVESTVGVGSTFWFELISVTEPKLEMNMDDKTALSQKDVNMDHGTWQHTLLYVEDNPANLKLVEQIIARHPRIHMLTAVNGMSGVKLARSSQPDVILLDINLPDISGLEVLKTLRADPSTLHIPVVALSANAMPHDIQKGLDAGFFRYITKPIKINEFMDALNTALEFASNESG